MMVNDSYCKLIGAGKSIFSVDDFIQFIHERELIRLRREQGFPAPWTDDIVLRSTKFTNIDRIHDDGTIRLLKMIEGKSEFDKLFYIVMYRCFYSAKTFFSQMSGNVLIDLERIRHKQLIVGQRLPYQIFLKKGQTICDFLDSVAYRVFVGLSIQMLRWKKIHLVTATEIISGLFKEFHGTYMQFLATEISKDIATALPEFVDSESQCPMNIGAKRGLAYLDNPAVVYLVRRTGKSWSVLEHALCEFSKYCKRKIFFEKNGYFLKPWMR